MNLGADTQHMALLGDPEACLPPSAPLEMPRQVLEDRDRTSIITIMSRLFLRSA